MADSNYEKSNAVKVVAGLSKIKSATKSFYQNLREQAHVTEADLNKLANLICGDLQVATVKVSYNGTQPNVRKANGFTGKTRLQKKTLGQYFVGRNYIRIFKHTAVKQKEITAKVALETLIHELNHHFDYKIVSLVKSIHSSGFYYRIGSLTDALKA